MAADSPLGELSVDVSLKYGSLFRVSSPLFQRGLALSVYDKSGILWIFAGQVHRAYYLFKNLDFYRKRCYTKKWSRIRNTTERIFDHER